MAIITTTFADLRALAETLSAANKLTIANSIFENSLLAEDIATRHLVVTGVKQGDVVPIIDDSVNYASFPFISQTSCESADCDLGIVFSGKKWDLGLIGCKIAICMKQFSADFRYFFQTNYQVLHNLDMESQLLVYLEAKFKNNFNGAKFRVAYFADTTTLEADPNYELLSDFDGFFTQAEAGDGVKLEFNQTNPTGEEAYAVFEQAYADFMESDWADKQGIVWKMTRKMASLWVRWMNGLKDRSMYNCECFSADGITALRTFTLEGQLSIFGIPVEIERDLDGIITQLSLDRPYRALLTYRNNLMIGTQETENLSEFDIWYDKSTKEVIIEGEVLIGAMIPTDEYIYIGAESDSPSV